MSEAKNTPIRALVEKSNLRSGDPVGSRDPLSGRMMSAVTEAYALYGGAYDPYPMHGARGAPAGHDEPGLSRYRNGQPGDPRYAAKEIGINDNLRTLPPVICDSAVRPSAADLRSSTSQVAGGFADTFKSAAAYVWDLCRRIRRERDIARSIVQLSNLDDRTLLDMGIQRSQIPHVVRYGRDESA